MRKIFKGKYGQQSALAVKRIRVDGKFVSKQKAFKILGLTADDLINNEQLQ